MYDFFLEPILHLPHKHNHLLKLGKTIIKQVNDALVFGSGNKKDDLERTSGWSNTVLIASRTPFSFKKNIKNNQWELTPLWSERVFMYDVFEYSNVIAKSMFHRVGNCFEKALVAVYFCANHADKSSGLPKFCEASVVRHPKLDHAFVKATSSCGKVIYIDPWSNECYLDEQKVFKCDGDDKEYPLNELINLFTVFINPKITNSPDNKHNEYFQCTTTKEEFLDICNKAIRMYSLSAMVHTEDVPKFLLGDTKKFITCKNYASALSEFVSHDKVTHESRISEESLSLARSRLRHI